MTRHTRILSSVAISNDGKMVVTGSWDRTVRRWKANSGESIGYPMKTYGPVRSVAISNDGKMIVSGLDDNTAFRWKAHSGEDVFEFHDGQSETSPLVQYGNSSGEIRYRFGTCIMLPAGYGSVDVNLEKNIAAVSRSGKEVMKNDLWEEIRKKQEKSGKMRKCQAIKLNSFPKATPC